MNYLILVINPGSTSTKVGLYNNDIALYTKNFEHPTSVLQKYDYIYDQYPMRLELVREWLKEIGIEENSLSCIVARGGLLPPIKPGGYAINKKMLDMILGDQIQQHASNLAAVMAAEIANPLGIPAYIYDGPTADEFPDIARITGMPEILRYSLCHVLNTRAVGRKYAESIGKTYEDVNLMIAHLGGGITVSAHQKGHIIDSLADDNGPFAPERAGSLPVLSIIDLCYSGNYTKQQIFKKVRGMGGLKALLGTSDCREIEKMIAEGNERAKLVYEAQAYQIAKGIGLLSPVMKGEIDAIVLTGGIAYSTMLTDMVIEYTKFIAPVVIIPGEFELESLALGGYRILKGEEEVKVF